MKVKHKKAWGAGFIVVLVILWQVLALIIGKVYVLPGPLDVVSSIWKNKAELFTQHLPETLKVMGIGMLCSIAAGTILAILMDMSSIAEKALYPILTVTQTIPVMCIAPVFVLWLGYSSEMRILVVILITFFSVTINLFDGFKASKKDREELLMTYGAGIGQRFFLLKAPSAIPHFFTALHVVLLWSAVGAAVAEWLGAPRGIGSFSRSCMANLDAPGLLAPLLLLTAVVLLANALLNIVEKAVLGKWYR